MQKKINSILICLLLSIFTVIVSAQEASNNCKSFRGTSLINLKTTENVSAGGFNFTIQHHFGQADIQNELLLNFFGMDLTSNIRIGFGVPISQNTYVGIGRTKHGKTYDFEFKNMFLKQTSDNKIPLSIAFYGNAAVSTTDFPQVQPDNYFGDLITPFEYNSKHHWTYMSQLILSRKFGNGFSILISPTFAHHNLVEVGEFNKRWILPVGAEVKTGLFSSIIFEYAHMFDNDGGKDNPYGIGWEYQTASHLFQLFVSNKNSILGQNYYMDPIGADFGKGTFFLGFNLHRTFWVKKY